MTNQQLDDLIEEKFYKLAIALDSCPKIVGNSALADLLACSMQDQGRGRCCVLSQVNAACDKYFSQQEEEETSGTLGGKEKKDYEFICDYINHGTIEQAAGVLFPILMKYDVCVFNPNTMTLDSLKEDVCLNGPSIQLTLKENLYESREAAKRLRKTRLEGNINQDR